MTLLRLLCAFYNVSPAGTRIILKDGKGKAVWSGCWYDKGCKKHLDRIVNDFEIDGLSATDSVKTLTVTVMEA